MQNQLTNLTDLMTKFVNSNTASISNSGTLPSNTIAKPRSDLKAITTRSGVSYDGPQIPPPPSSLPPVVENKPEATKDTVNPTNNGNIEDVQPQAVHPKPKKLSEMARTSLNEHCSAILLKKLPKKLRDPCKFLIPCDFPGMAECLALADLGASTNLMPYSVWKILSLSDLTPTCMTLELVDRSITSPVGIAEDVYVKVGDDKLLVIIAKDLSVEEKTALIIILKSHKRAIAWKLSDIKGINPEFCTHKILMEEDFEPAVQHQRMVNPKIHDVIKQEVIKLLKAGLIYPISDSPWVSLVHCVPKKGGFTVVKNEDNELIPTRLVTGWRVCIDYRKLNEATRKDYFPLPFIDDEKTTFTCPYGTFAYRRMPFGLCNAPGTFQRCMMAIFYDMIEKTMEVFMDDFSVFKNSFQSCLSHLDQMLKRYEDTNLYLNWEKSHFMVKEGIVLSHKISKQGIEVDKAKSRCHNQTTSPDNCQGH
nr:retrovirus-related Pol polyprotein from transposon 17.6 [Tanacetum cinerariifolium]